MADRKHQPLGPEVRWKRAEDRLVIAALLGVAFVLGCFPMADFDVWWHLRAGQMVLQSGHLPRVDDWTYTNAGKPWIDLYWLFQVAIAALYSLGGSSALVLLKASAGTAIVALALSSRRSDAPAWPAALVWIPALVSLSGRLCERPELFSLLFCAGYLAILSHAETRPRRLWLLPFLQVLWVNCHGFFVLGPLMLAAYWVDLLYRRRRSDQKPAAAAYRTTLVLASGATLLGCLASPYGPRAVALSLEQFHKLGGAGIYRTNIGELRTQGDFIAINGIWNPYLLSVLVVFALGLLSFVLQARRRGFQPFRVLLFLGAGYLGWQATRNSSLFALVAATVTCWNLDDGLRSSAAVAPQMASRRRGRSERGGRSRTPARGASTWALGAIAALALATLSGGLYAWAGEGRTVGLGERKQWYAHEACRFLARPDLPERIVAFNLGQAAVCIAHAAPAHKLFMDPRLEVNSPETFERYLSGLRLLWRGDVAWEAALGIDYQRPAELPALLIERGVLARAAYVLARDPRWRCVHADSVATVFVPSTWAESHGLDAVNP
jgi:hypothetical protein